MGILSIFRRKPRIFRRQPATPSGLSCTFVRVVVGTIRDAEGTNHKCLTLWADIHGSADPGMQASRWKTTGKASDFLALVEATCRENRIAWVRAELWAMCGRVPICWTEFPEGTEWLA